MAYGVKYYAEFSNPGNECTESYRVELLLKDYVGIENKIENLNPDPFQLKFRGSKETLKNILFGSEAVFKIHYDGTYDFTELFESNYKDWKLNFLSIEASTSGIYDLQWSGYIKPENMRRSYLECDYFISISATDSLADLKDIDYPNTEGRATILEVVKTCFQQTGIELDFKIHLNTYESTYMSASECALQKVDINQKRFIKYEDGLAINDKCYNVLEEVLRPFNVVLRQNAGYWTIYNFEEINSWTYTFDFLTLTQQNRITDDLTYSIQAHDFTNTGTLTMFEPVKKYDLTFINRNLGENILTNGDFTNGTSEFQNGTTPNGYHVFQVPTGKEYLECTAIETFDILDNDLWFQTDDFAIQWNNDDDYCVVSWDVTLNNVDWKLTATNKLFFCQMFYGVETTTGNYTYYADTPRLLTTIDNTYTFESSANLPILSTGTGNYHVRFKTYSDYPNELEGTYTLFYDNISWTSVNTGGAVDVTFDTQLSQSLTNPKFVKVKKNEISFGDSIQTNDVGNLKINNNLTKDWRTYSNTEDINILWIHIQQFLRNNSQYKNYLSISIEDVADEITANHVLTFDNKNYVFASYNKDYAKGFLKANLIEVQTASVAMDQIVITKLLSVDGNSSGSSSSVGGAVRLQNLQETTDMGNTTDSGLNLINSASTWNIDVNSSGHLILDGPTNGNLHVSGDIVAFSSVIPPSASWWDAMPVASISAPVGGIIVGSGLSITGAGVLSTTGGLSSWLELTDTPATFTADKWVGVNSTADGLEFKNAPIITETDTLDSVTTRGSTTTNDLSIGKLTIATTKFINHNNDNSYDKIRLWGTGSRSIGFNTGLSYGWVTSNAMTFTGAISDGFLWRKDGSASTDGLMSLSSGGGLTVGYIGFGGDTTANLGKTGDFLRYTNSAGFIEIGGSTTDTAYAYIQTNKSRFHLNKAVNITTAITFDKNLTNTLSDVSNALRWTSGGTYYFEVTSSSTVCSMRTAALTFNMNKNLTVSGTITATGEVTAFSDRKFKTEIKPLENSITDKLMALNPVRFKKDNKQQIGLIAQDVQKLMPEFITEHEQGLSLNYQQMVAVLIKTVQQQQTELNKIKKQLNEFRNNKY